MHLKGGESNGKFFVLSKKHNNHEESILTSIFFFCLHKEFLLELHVRNLFIK